MNRNVKIAKELVRLAKALIVGATNVADKEGKYENFTGTIDWEGSKGEVENATFELSSGGHYVYWTNGTWKNGILNEAVWSNGIWENGTLLSSWWHRGVWKNGICKDIIWQDGTWENGTWDDSIWHHGTWKDGIWKGDKWYNGTWEKGTWEKGWWNMGYDQNDNFHDENDSPDKWQI